MSSTGAISLCGRVCRVDAVPDKVTGALEWGQRAVLLPTANQSDVLGLPDHVRAGIECHFVSNVDQALRSAVVGE